MQKGQPCNSTPDDATKLACQRTPKENKKTNIGKDGPEEILKRGEENINWGRKGHKRSGKRRPSGVGKASPIWGGGASCE